jgi:primase-polymerase (primpol)-like protein
MEKMETSHIKSEHLLNGHSNECIVSRTPIFNNSISKELEIYPQCVLWKPKKRDGKLTKVLYTVLGYTASTKNPGTWANFEAVSSVLSDGADTYSDLSFVLADIDPFIFFDLGLIIGTVTGEFEPGNEEEITILNFHTATSQQSGQGTHMSTELVQAQGMR